MARQLTPEEAAEFARATAASMAATANADAAFQDGHDFFEDAPEVAPEIAAWFKARRESTWRP